MFRADFLPFTSKIVEHSRYLPIPKMDEPWASVPSWYRSRGGRCQGAKAFKLFTIFSDDILDVEGFAQVLLS
jgi:hypothetical protein